MIPDIYQRTATATVLITVFLSAFFFAPAVALGFLFASCLLYILIIEWPRIARHNATLWLLAPLYPVSPFIVLILLNQTINRWMVLYLFYLVVAYDTGGYLIGSWKGKRLIAPTISPHKTWEGVFGGYLLAFTAQTIFLLYFHLPLTWWSIGIIPFVTSILALAGDLFESLLKRNAGLKDSGSLLPGHGGLLDRFDSVLFAVFFFYYLATSAPVF